MDGPWKLIFRIGGGALIVYGLIIWFVGALKSDMDESIIENKLKTDGLYAWVRNPMYSGWWFALTGISFVWHNIGRSERIRHKGEMSNAKVQRNIYKDVSTYDEKVYGGAIRKGSDQRSV